MLIRRRTALFLSTLALAALVAAGLSGGPARAAGFACYGAPPDYVTAFDATDGAVDGRVSYPEPRFFMDNQSWWVEGAGDATSSIAAAQRAAHLHYGLCFPFMETWSEASGTLTIHAKLQAHKYQGGLVREVGGLGFLDGGVRTIALGWRPTSDNETRFVTLTRPTSTLTRCGRVESRMHLEGVSPNGGDRQFTSTGFQSLVTCSGSRTSSSDRSGTAIGRSWYVGANYGNGNLADDFRGSVGFGASDQSLPVSSYRVRYNLSSGANAWLVTVDPDIHNGSFGRVVSRGAGTTVTADLTPQLVVGPNRAMFVACERVGVSTANPAGGQNCNAMVLPVLRA